MFEPSFRATIEPHPDAYEPTSPVDTPPPASPVHTNDPPVKVEEEPLPFPKLPPYDPFKAPSVNFHPDTKHMAREDRNAPTPDACPCAPSATEPGYEPFALFQALGAAFAIGATVGGLLTYSFSRRAVVEILSEAA